MLTAHLVFQTGDRPFAICCNASSRPLALRDLHAGTDVVAYVDPKLPKPAGATAAGAETLPLPAGPKPALLSKNFQDAFRPAVGPAHLKVRTCRLDVPGRIGPGQEGPRWIEARLAS